jgi:Holliday junction resolvasome RuvABC endonuclease subunit
VGRSPALAATVIQGGILCLDLSSTVGAAYGHKGDARPWSTSWRLAKGSQLGPRFVGFENELIRALDDFRPRRVVMEAPLPAAQQASTFVARQQFGLAAYCEGVCCRADVDCREMPANVVRKAVLGRVPTGGADRIKAEIMAWCRAQGWNPCDHNCGDALVLWCYATGRVLNPRFAFA